ncbi:DnaJ-domain-containing protein [Westerdykella ornata]|uniref:DnaJ-domain-containing protein n=1 Tax=Westerdykella ornata TaxID=318751 RepID=A0A6A6J7X6_WESOR|nr:DnaJ-domain-containing protein [Westerdykella ornata]KAF2271309.1 DnaJ-domain-containing protein [Westerdykella ornata]
MSIQTHYEALGLDPTALMPVIKSAYKALALIYHPDNSHGLEPAQRAEHAAKFRAIQEAYDVLTNPALRAAYDRELQRDGNKVNLDCSTFHHAQRSRAFKQNGRPSVFITTPAAKEALRTRIELQLAQIKKDRLKRDYEDASMDLAGIQITLSLWRDMAEERADDPIAYSYCLTQIQEYEHKLKVREAEQEAWLNALASPKTAASHKADSTQKQQQTHTHLQNIASSLRNASGEKIQAESTQSRRTATKQSHETKRHLSASQKRAETEHRESEEQMRRAEARKADKARREALKKQQQEAKAAAIRAEKLKQKRKVQEAAAKEAQRIKKVREKVKPGTLLTKMDDEEAIVNWPLVDTPLDNAVGSNTAAEVECVERKSNGRIKCNACDHGHASFREWKECNANAKGRGDKALESNENGFFCIV